MAEGSLNIEELRGKVGTEWKLGGDEIEKGMIRRFAQAIDDPNPLWQNEEYANQSRYGGIIARPTFIQSIGGEQFGQMLDSIPCKGILNGGVEFEFYQPIKLGDIVTSTAKMVNIREREGKMGKMAIITFDITYINQRQEVIAVSHQTLIYY